MKLRSFEKSDLDLYEKFASEFLSGPATFGTPNRALFERNIDHILESENCFGWFMMDEDIVLGYTLASMMFSTEVGGYQLWIEELSIDERYRGKGIGTLTLDMLINMFPDVKRFRLEVTPINEGAKKLYERMGFEFLTYEQMILDR